MSNTIDLVKELSRGPCGCQYNMGSGCTGTYDPITGESTPGWYDRGPRTHHCTRCRAREALEADGVEYEKDNRRQWHGYKVDPATVAKTYGVCVGSGSMGFQMW